MTDALRAQREFMPAQSLPQSLLLSAYLRPILLLLGCAGTDCGYPASPESSPHIGIAVDPSRKTPNKDVKAAARIRLLIRSAAWKALPKDRPQGYNHLQCLSHQGQV